MEDGDHQTSFLFFSELLRKEFSTAKSSRIDLNNQRFFLEQMSSLCGKVIYLLDHTAGKYVYISENAQEIIGSYPIKKDIQGNHVYRTDFFLMHDAESLKDLIKVAQERLKKYLTKKELLNISYTIKFDTIESDGRRNSFLQRGKVLQDVNNGFLPLESGYWLNVSYWQPNSMQYLYVSSGSKNYFLKCDTESQESSVIRLSKAQLKVLNALKHRNNLTEAAELLSLSKHTLQTHCKHILHKTGFSSRYDLLNFALEAGIV